MTKTKKIIDVLTEDQLFEMANLSKATTGLPVIIWISGKGKEQHEPRIKVQKDSSGKLDPNNLFSITISDNPEVIGKSKLSQKDIEQIINFIKLNKDILLRYWNHELVTNKFIELLIPINN